MSDRLDSLYAPASNKSQLLRNLAEYELAIERDVTVAFDLCLKAFFYNVDQVDAKPEKWFRLHLDPSPILHASIDVFPRDAGEYIIHLSKGLIFALDDCFTTIIGDPRFFAAKEIGAYPSTQRASVASEYGSDFSPPRLRYIDYRAKVQQRPVRYAIGGPQLSTDRLAVLRLHLMFALLWIILHEVNHFWHFHLDYVQRLSASAASEDRTLVMTEENSSITRLLSDEIVQRVMEWEADNHAMRDLRDFVRKQFIRGDEEILFRALSNAISIVGLIFEWVRKNYGTSAYYPLPKTRIYSTIKMLMGDEAKRRVARMMEDPSIALAEEFFDTTPLHLNVLHDIAIAGERLALSVGGHEFHTPLPLDGDKLEKILHRIYYPNTYATHKATEAYTSGKKKFTRESFIRHFMKQHDAFMAAANSGNRALVRVLSRSPAMRYRADMVNDLAEEDDELLAAAKLMMINKTHFYRRFRQLDGVTE